MGYNWDVFISYRRDTIPQRWLEETFLPLFKHYLRESLGGREVNIYRDTECIEGGANWRNNIKKALATSKCIVPILIPSYFHSDWCTKEIAVIYHRQKQLGLATINNPKSLIIPLKVRDGIFFSEKIKEIQILDCNNYYRVGAGVESTDLYIKLQDKLSVWIEDVALAINNAPDWNSDWLTDDWLEISNQEFLMTQNEFNIKTPKL